MMGKRMQSNLFTKYQLRYYIGAYFVIANCKNLYTVSCIQYSFFTIIVISCKAAQRLL